MVDRICEMDPSQRPRERLLEWGPGVLSDAELLAVLMRTGRRGHGAVSEAHRLLRETGGLSQLAAMAARELMTRPGVGLAKAATLSAAAELGRRLARAEVKDAERLDQPRAAGDFLVCALRGRRREVFGFISLDVRHRFIRDHQLSLGTRTQAPVEPAELFRRALLDDAAGVLVFHNHPSGALEPSTDDLALTRRLARAGELVGIPVLDHLLVADTRWLSLRQLRPELFVMGP